MTITDIQGWTTNREGKLLYRLAKKVKQKGVIVEIGSWKGKSTIYLATGSKAGNNAKIYAIDPHTGSKEHKEMLKGKSTFNEFKRNIKNAGIENLVIPILKTSEQAALNFNKPVDLIFIDGDHDYQAVLLDFNKWFPKVVNGGIMVFDDTINWQGPIKVVEENIYKSLNFRNIGFTEALTYAEKVSKNSFTDRLRNRFALFLRQLYVFEFKLKAKIKLKPEQFDDAPYFSLIIIIGASIGFVMLFFFIVVYPFTVGQIETGCKTVFDLNAAYCS